jgi:outer membrane receptor protein involved in Fe transport
MVGFAQFPGAGNGGGRNMNQGHLYGKVVDSITGRGLSGASIRLTTRRRDSATKQMRDFPVKSTLSAGNGDFNLEQLPVFGTFTLNISVIGYKPVARKVGFNLQMPNGGMPASEADQQAIMQRMLNMVDKDLGNIKLEADTAKKLEDVVVESSAKKLFEMGVDRKIFNVDQNLAATGQTGVEVMRQIPTLNVDIDGNVTMRNSTPQIFVDGRPTTLTLDQIPADLIDKVELITNPSAKFDASGGNAGIVNIVLKKNKRTGYNGGLRAGADSRGRINGGGDFNFRQDKINVFLSGMYNQRKSKSWTDTRYQDRQGVAVLSGTGLTDGEFGFLRGGFDYFIDNRNTLTLSGNFAKGGFGNDEQQFIDSINRSNSVRNTATDGNFRNFGSQLSFKHNFAKSGHNWTADVNYNGSTNDNLGDFTTYTVPLNNNPSYTLQKTSGSGYNRFLTLQSDYENPITENSKIEAGVRAAIRNFRNENIQSLYNQAAKEYVDLASLSNNYKFNDQVYAAYVTYSLKKGKFNYQLGLRAESSRYKGDLLGKDSSFKVNFPISLFPSAFITYKLTEKDDIQLNYSRRVNRPSFFQLMPFYDITDPINPRIGNAALKPEFTNSFELSYNKSYSKGANFLVSAYFKHTDNLITSYYLRQPKPAGYPNIASDTINVVTFANANYSLTYGLELTNRIVLAKIWDMTANVNLFNSNINANNVEGGLTNNRVSWFAKLNNSIKLPKKFTVQVSGDYQAKTVLPNSGGGGGGRGGGGGFFFGGGNNLGTAQGYIAPRYSVDLSIRKDFSWKGGNTASVTLSATDIFRTQLMKTYSESAFFVQESQRRRDPQVVRLNISWRFGKFDVSLFKRKNVKAEMNGASDMMQGM